MAMYDNQNTVEKSFDLSYISEHLIQAQWAEFIELKKTIYHLSSLFKRPISILDIGIGNGRIPMHLCGVKEMWDLIACYDGTDNAQSCIDITNANLKQYGIADKVSATLFDATRLNEWCKKYDMVVCTWFTPGNFYPDDFDFANYADSQPLDLTENKKFTHIFLSAYNLLLPGGKLVLGACYKDNNATRLKQQESYGKMGMTVITSEADSFTATREGFWSQRFTHDKMFNYTSFAKKEQVVFKDLDTYQYAMQVTITKE